MSETAPLRVEIELAVSDHYDDTNWTRTHRGSRCLCGWIGEDHPSHLTDILMEVIAQH